MDKRTDINKYIPFYLQKSFVTKEAYELIGNIGQVCSSRWIRQRPSIYWYSPIIATKYDFKHLINNGQSGLRGIAGHEVQLQQDAPDTGTYQNGAYSSDKVTQFNLPALIVSKPNTADHSGIRPQSLLAVAEQCLS